MTSVARVADGIYRIDVGLTKATASGKLSYSLVHLVVSDGEAAIIDTSPGAVTPEILAAIRGTGYDPSKLSHIILTHIHLDHAGGAGHLARQLPGVKVAVHKRGASHLIEPQKLIEGTKEAYGANFEAGYGPILPVRAEQVYAVDDGEIIKVGKRALRIIYTPGHASHHIAIYDERSRGVFSGDSLGFLQEGNNCIIIVAGFDLELALQSIDTIKALEPRRIYAAHGTADRDAGEFIESVRTTTKDYGDIILKAMNEGKDKKEMERRLMEYHKKRSPDDSGTALRRFDEIIPWYVAYFKKKGIA